jgi:hypothetical protein
LSRQGRGWGPGKAGLDPVDRVFQRGPLLDDHGRRLRPGGSDHSRKGIARGLVNLLANGRVGRVLPGQGLPDEAFEIRQLDYPDAIGFGSFIAFVAYCNRG